eukprot:CAMPEP_0177759430 /NCGR_PEP_ID=MMETSP0491_2-20121128/4729_1 /TAXON_ID=63592 /ORGANISM="Tetraselmis chuii, Strain PLY429" /LENGTH=541 /DNA_ID=CAMNT_0019275261 /DNA_START=204 /DNA_END=1829 /DNA_ORIENTATION=-
MQWAQNLGQRLRGYTTPADGPDQAAAQQRATRPASARQSQPQSEQSSGLSVGTLVKQATSEMLIGPDWGANMELIDAINRGGARGQGHAGEHALKQLKKPLTGSNPHVQVLALTVIEACMKNCGSEFHQKFAFNECWAAMQMMAGKPGTDASVNNKCLEMIEDWAHGLSFPIFREAYDGMKRKGVNFPPHEVATPADFMAVQPPPRSHIGGPGGGSPQHIPDGVSEEDRRAIEAAMAEFASQEPEPRRQEGSGPDASWDAGGGGGYQPPSQTAVMEPPPTVAQQASPPPPPRPQYTGPSLSASQPADKLMQDLESAKGIVGLLEEMLKSVPADNAALVMQDHIIEVAEQAAGMRPRLQALAETCADEQALMTTLTVAEELEAALLKRDQLAATAASGVARPSQPPTDQLHSPAAPAVQAPRLAPPPRGGPPADTSPLINLMDDAPSDPVRAAAPNVDASGQDPFLPMSTNAAQSSPVSSATNLDGLAQSFDQLTTGGPATSTTTPAAAEADLFEGLTMSGSESGRGGEADKAKTDDPFAGL